MGNSDFVKKLMITGFIIFIGLVVIVYGKAKEKSYNTFLVITRPVIKVEPIYYGITFGKNKNSEEFDIDLQLKYGTENYKKSKPDKYKLIAEYYVDGVSYTAEKKIKKVEKELVIRYNPENPSDYIAETKLSTVPDKISEVGVIIILAGVIKFFFDIVVKNSSF